jgi:hypothetical protein
MNAICISPPCIYLAISIGVLTLDRLGISCFSLFSAKQTHPGHSEHNKGIYSFSNLSMNSSAAVFNTISLLTHILLKFLTP